MSFFRHPLFVVALALAAGMGAMAWKTAESGISSAQVVTFPDVDPWTLEGKATIYLREEGILSGFDDGTFRGDTVFTRAQTAKMFLLAAKKPLYNVRNAGVFSDVYDNQWYARYVLSAAINEMLNGYPDGTFRPDQTVNTAEFLKLVSTTFKVPEFMPHSYQDVISTDWFNKYAGIAKRYRLFPDRFPGLLEPDRPLTRKEAAIALYQYLTFTEESSSSRAVSSPASLIIESAGSSSLVSSAAPVPASSSLASSTASSSASPLPTASSSSQASSSAFSLQSQVCYFPPAPPKGCYYVCAQNVSCLSADQCKLECAASSKSSSSL